MARMGEAGGGGALLRWLVALAALLCVSAIALSSWGAEPVVLSQGADEIGLGRHLDYLEDPEGKLTLDDVRSAAMEARWTASNVDIPNFGFTSNTYWFRFDVDNPGSASIERVLDVGYPVLDEISLYAGEHGVLRERRAGDHLPVSVREIRHEHFLFTLQCAPGMSPVFLRVRSSSALQVPLTLWSRAAFEAADRTTQIENGFYYGVMLVMVAYNLFVFMSVRDRSYLYYCAYVLSFVVFQASIDGRTYEYFWPESPSWNDKFLPVSEGLLLIAISSFPRVFLNLKKGMPRFFNAAMLVLTWYGVAVVVAAFTVPYRYIGTSMVLAGIFGSPAAVGAGVVAWRRGQRSASFYVVAWTTFFAGAAALMFNKLGLAPRNLFTEHGMQIGSLLEVVLLSFALADRINIMRAETIAVERRAKETLQDEVNRQTHELKDQAQKLQELDRQKTHFFQNVSHELRTPLTLILNPLDEMAREPGYSTDKRLDVATKNSRRLLRLVNQLLDFQKLSAGKKEWRLVPIDLVRFVESCAEYFAPTCVAQGIEFRVQVPNDGAVAVRAEADALEKIVFNYLANALKHAPAGGHIELSLEVTGERARVAVKDDGPGLSEDGKNKLFKLFSQADGGADHAGTGLGLALVKELAEAMGGEVGVDSAVGKGSTFWAAFPRAKASGAEAARPVLATGRQMGEVVAAARASIRLSAGQPVSKRIVSEDAPLILVVDDIADMRDLVGGTLARHGYRLASASSGGEALDAAKRNKPDVVVTDWMMPGMTGPELIGAMRKDSALASVPVVLLTAKSDEESKLAGTEVGADAFLGKPFNEQELASTVRNLVHLKEREREVERLNRHIAENVLKRYLPPPLVDEILSGRTSLDVEPETAQATVLFGDLAGFTKTSAQLRATKMARLLNEYLSKMNDVVFAHGGTIDKYMGDGIMVIFGAPVRLEARDQVHRAAKCALAMQRAMTELHAQWRKEGLPEIPLRIGVHHGPVVVGNFGDARRSDYTAIGPAVNLASRIEGQCPPGSVLVSGEVCDFLPEAMAEDAGTFQLKGIEGVVRCFRLVDRDW
jgi:signal transduction histidine kinase/DNA-binding response OmpR family regulator